MVTLAAVTLAACCGHTCCRHFALAAPRPRSEEADAHAAAAPAAGRAPVSGGISMSIHFTPTFQQHGAAAWRAQEAFHYSIHLTLTFQQHAVPYKRRIQVVSSTMYYYANQLSLSAGCGGALCPQRGFPGAYCRRTRGCAAWTTYGSCFMCAHAPANPAWSSSCHVGRGGSCCCGGGGACCCGGIATRKRMPGKSPGGTTAMHHRPPGACTRICCPGETPSGTRTSISSRSSLEVVAPPLAGEADGGGG